MKKFAVSVNGLTDADEKSFIEFLRRKKCGWWHRIANFWLVQDESNSLEANEIRDFLMDLKNSKIGLVMVLQEVDEWSGFAPSTIADESFDWIERVWDIGESK